MDIFKIPSPLHEIKHHPGVQMGINLFMKRDDLIHADVGGNKWRKLKYNIEEAKKLNTQALVTAGGPWSNHLAATAAAGNLLGFKTKAFIRGVEPKTWSDTLQFCSNNGMGFIFLPRKEFDTQDFSQQIQHTEYYIPLGGENVLGVKGCSEIIDEIDIDFDIFCAPIGTGTTLKGIGNRIPDKKLIGFSAVKPDQHNAEFNEWIRSASHVFLEYDEFGGFARSNSILEDFIVEFQLNNKITLDPVYTGKMMFSLFSLIEKRRIKEDSVVIALHTGGLQGIKGFPDLHSRLFTK